MLTLKDLLLLGFQRNFVPSSESGDISFHYFTYTIGKNHEEFCLITNSSDYWDDEGIEVQIFDYTIFKYNNITELRNLIFCLETGVK